jgi:hypothetical protein
MRHRNMTLQNSAGRGVDGCVDPEPLAVNIDDRSSSAIYPGEQPPAGSRSAFFTHCAPSSEPARHPGTQASGR